MIKEKAPKNFFEKIIYWINNKITPDDILREDEIIAFEIFKSALHNPNCIRILNTSLSGKKYIVPKSYYTDHDTSSCVILNSYANRITIVNHIHKYDILIPTKTCGIMDQMFDDKVQDERDSLEQEILKNTIESLSVVLENFKEKEILKN